MKICHIITSLNNGGAEKVLLRLIEEDESNTHDVISLFPKIGLYGEFEHNCRNVLYLNLNNIFSFLVSFWKTFYFLRRTKPDVVQTWMYHADLFGGLAAKLAGINVLIWNIRQSNFGRLKINNIRTRLIRRVCAILSNIMPTRIVCVGNEAKSCHLEIGYSSKKMEVIFNGVKVNVNPKKRPPLKRFVIGVVARFHPQKNHSEFLIAISQIINRIENLKVVLVGRGMDLENQEIVSLIENLGLLDVVELRGNILSEAALTDVYNEVDLLVLPSSFGEGFPNVLVEAMAHGVPSVATDVGESKLIVDDCGWISVDSTSKGLASKILEAHQELSVPEIKKKYFECCVSRATAEFSVGKMKHKYLTLWQTETSNRVA